MPKVVTANDLTTGAVVFLGPEGWIAALADATTYPDADAAEVGMARAERDVGRAIVVEPFVTEVGIADSGKPAMKLRDRIRAFGPTIRFTPAG